jgi:hypothetical protein
MPGKWSSGLAKAEQRFWKTGGGLTETKILMVARRRVPQESERLDVLGL